ncbi:hypothetical protein HanXRQr2_Chr09g0379901 [Helianthus annuus]|uniref:Uncharacterized protein n=1 Tax=Helianthus annuus TaxID=4232 RepID=A0A9K3I4A3_HELAN|nr:hypothetical protein HanXRQr2_Chr09g0379901 [Helianthus annuus]
MILNNKQMSIYNVCEEIITSGFLRARFKGLKAFSLCLTRRKPEAELKNKFKNNISYKI